jgi:Na+-transporting NADH:ubiquinone oxidoreductase subunit A
MPFIHGALSATFCRKPSLLIQFKMSAIRIQRGLDIPLAGGLKETSIKDGPTVTEVAIVAKEFIGLKPKMLIRAGDPVKVGTPLFFDKRDPEVLFTSPAAGTVRDVSRGDRRTLLSVSIQLEGTTEQETLMNPGADASAEDLRTALAANGLWTRLRQRPFDTVATLQDRPHALFLTAMDTRPLAPSPLAVLAGQEEAFRAGAQALSRLTDANTWLCHDAEEDWTAFAPDGVLPQSFKGAHPAGNAGVHINSLAPVGPHRTAWHVGYQDVAAIGHFLLTGQLTTNRVVAIVGPAVISPQIWRTNVGANLDELCKDKSSAQETRIISGSALCGATANAKTPEGFLGSRANQVTLLENQTSSKFLEWPNPFAGTHTTTNTTLAKFFRKTFSMDTDSHGSHRAIVPIGSWEEVMPMDILPTQLIKALVSNDVEMAEKLGVLELAEEDLALCEYADFSKTAITDALRTMLTRIQKEG